MGASLARAWSDGSIGYALVWWATLLILGAMTWSGLRRWTGGWHDAGWPVARHAGLLAAAVIVWIPAHLAPVFTRTAVLASVLALAAGAWWLRRSPRSGPALPRIHIRVLAMAELRFALPLAFYLLMRGFNGDAVGLEKFMDYAFLNAAVHSQSMPPPDPWFSGKTINYYYFGQYLAAFVCKLTGTPPRFGYNLMLATMFAGVFQLAWSLVAELAAGVAPRVRNLAAVTAAFWITMGGNLHAFLYGLLRPLLVASGFATAPAQTFLISDPTRFVGYNPPRPDKLITEFPAYAFYVGDLHAHLVNLPNVLLFLCATLGWLRARSANDASARGWLAGAAALLGLFVAANTWDAGMYGGLLAALLGWPLVSRTATPRGARTLLDMVIAASVATFVAAWFLVGFRPPGQGVGLTHSHTPLWQWMVLYGWQTALAFAGLILLRRRRATPETSMVVALTACGVGFAIVPELVYLKDIYGAEYYRGNTAFKFGFQAFLLLTLCACVAVAMLIDWIARANWRPAVAVLAIEALLLPPLCYGWFVASAALGPWRDREWSLDGGRHLMRHAEDAQIVRCLDANRRPGDVLVEAVGDSFSFAARISTYSAIPAVLGWPVHELLWRRLDPEVDARREAVGRLYAATDPDAARAIAARYGARWIVVGETERALYPQLNELALTSIGHVVFQAGQSFIVELPSEAALPAAMCIDGP